MKKSLVIMILLLFIILPYCASDRDFTEMTSQPILIASMNNPEDDPEDDAFGDEAMLSSITPTFVWSEIGGADSYQLVIYDVGRKKTYIYDTDDASTTFTIPDEDNQKLTYSYVINKEFTPFKWQIRGKNSFQMMPSEDTRLFYIKNAIPPETSITIPTTGSVVPDEFDITIQSSDDLGLETVEISIDGGEFIVVWERTENDYEIKQKSDIYPENMTGLAFGLHTICVKATDMHGNTTLIDGNPPADDCINVIKLPPAPTLCGDEINSCNLTPTLCWNAVTGASSYEIDLASDSGFTTTIFSNVSTTGSTYTTPQLANGTYYWRVRTVYVDGTGTEYRSESYTTGSFTINRPAVAAPTGLTGPGDGCVGGTFNFSWTVSAEHTYVVQYSSNGSSWTDATVTGGTATSVISTAGTYTWRVQGTTICNDVSNWVVSPAFIVKSVSPPANLSGPTSACQGSNFVMTWTSTAEHTYTIEYSANTPTSWIVLTSGLANSTFSNNTFTANTYKWRMKSVHACGESAWVTGTNFSVYYNPVNPTVLTQPANGNANASFTFTWNTSAGNTYDVQYTTDVGDWTTPTPVTICSNTTGPSCSIVIATQGTYKWRVMAKTTNCGNGTWQVDTDTFIVSIPCTPVPSITGLNVADTCEGSTVSMTWNSISNADYIYVKISTDGAVDGNNKFTTPVYTSADLKSTTPTSHSTTFTWAPSGSAPWSKVYYWQVNATNACTDLSVNGTNINIYRNPVGQPVLVDPPNAAKLFQDNKPSFYWTAAGVAGQTGYSLEASENTGYAPKLASTPEHISGAGTTEFTNGLTNKLYTSAPSSSKTVYWHVRGYNTLTQCGGPWSNDSNFLIRFGASGSACSDVSTNYYLSWGEQPLGITYVPNLVAAGGIPVFLVAVHNASSCVGCKPFADGSRPYVDIYATNGGYVNTVLHSQLASCNYLGDIKYYSTTNKIYISCNAYDNRVFVFNNDATLSLNTTINLTGVASAGGMSIGNDGSDSIFIADRNVYEYPGTDIPLKKYNISGGALQSSYTIQTVMSAFNDQFATWGINFDPSIGPNGIVSVVAKEASGQSSVGVEIQAFNESTGALAYKWEVPPVPFQSAGKWNNTWGFSKTFGPPIPSGPSYGPAPNGRYVLATAEATPGNPDGVMIYRVSGSGAKWVGGLMCATGLSDLPSGVDVNPNSYDMWITTAQYVAVKMAATTP